PVFTLINFRQLRSYHVAVTFLGLVLPLLHVPTSGRLVTHSHPSQREVIEWARGQTTFQVQLYLERGGDFYIPNKPSLGAKLRYKKSASLLYSVQLYWEKNRNC